MTAPPTLVICLGAQKAGTSSLHAWLGSLGEVSTSRHGKEIDYFSHHFDAGHGWYLDHFDRSKPFWLDVSPNYAIVGDLAERMATLPVPYRCVLLARDPVQRALSQHRHELIVHPKVTPTAFEDALALNPTYVANGLYGRMLEGLARLLDDGRLEVVWFDDLTGAPEETVGRLCATLGIEGRPRPDLLRVPANVSVRSRYRWLHAARRTAGRVVRRVGGEQAVARFRRDRLVQRALAANTSPPAGEAPLPPATIAAMIELRSRFLPDLERAERISGLPFVDRLGGGFDG